MRLIEAKSLDGLRASPPRQAAAHRPRLSPGVLLLACLVASTLALTARSPDVLALLALAEAALLWAGGATARLWRQAGRLLLWQGVLIVGLHLLRFGLAAGIVPGLRIAAQLFLAFLPGLVLMQTMPHAQLTALLHRWLPQRSAFVVAASLHFVPLMMREARQIYEAQRLRGARLTRADLLRPWRWGDLIHCVLVPTIVRMVALAGAVALAAEARDFGIQPRRSCWPGAGTPSGQSESP